MVIVVVLEAERVCNISVLLPMAAESPLLFVIESTLIQEPVKRSKEFYRSKHCHMCGDARRQPKFSYLKDQSTKKYRPLCEEGTCIADYKAFDVDKDLSKVGPSLESRFYNNYDLTKCFQCKIRSDSTVSARLYPILYPLAFCKNNICYKTFFENTRETFAEHDIKL